MRSLTCFAFGALCVAGVLVAASCGSPGAGQDLFASSGGTGGWTPGGDPSGGTAPDHVPAPSGGTGGAIDFGDFGSWPSLPSGSVDDGQLGAGCTRNGDCAEGLACLQADSGLLGGGGPAGGVCTVECTSDVSVCASLAPGAVCYGVGQRGFCFEGCTYGPVVAGSAKCHGRLELACTPVPLGTAQTCVADGDCDADGFCAATTSGGRRCFTWHDTCLPQCNGSQDCPAGLGCDMGAALFGFGMGLCRAVPGGGLTTGEPCDLDAATDPCRGICIPLYASGNEGVCGDGCTAAPPPGCGWLGPGSGPADAACLYYFGDVDLGDAAVCAQLCDCNDDCSHPAFVCNAFPLDSGLAELFGRVGVCDPPPGGAGGGTAGIPCPAGG